MFFCCCVTRRISYVFTQSRLVSSITSFSWVSKFHWDFGLCWQCMILKLYLASIAYVTCKHNSNCSLSLFVISPQIVVECCVYLVSCTLVNISVTFFSQLMCIWYARVYVFFAYKHNCHLSGWFCIVYSRTSNFCSRFCNTIAIVGDCCVQLVLFAILPRIVCFALLFCSVYICKRYDFTSSCRMFQLFIYSVVIIDLIFCTSIVVACRLNIRCMCTQKYTYCVIFFMICGNMKRMMLRMYIRCKIYIVNIYNKDKLQNLL